MDISYETTFGIIPLFRHNEKWEVFLVKHKKGSYWGFPKGHPNVKENPQKAAERELFEETGLKVIQFFSCESISERYQFFREEKSIDKTVHYFLAKVTRDYQLQQEEIIDGVWLSIEAAYDKITFPEGKELCQKLQNIV